MARRHILGDRTGAFLPLLALSLFMSFSEPASEGQDPADSGTETAQSTANAALQTIVADLQAEIVSGSTATSPAPNVTVYYPKSPATVSPARVGSNNALANLLKRSAGGQPFFAGPDYSTAGPMRAGAVSSTNTSANGRSISTARWNRALLLPKENAWSDTDLTPLSSGPNAFEAPDWVLVARDGSNPTAWNQNMRASQNDPSSVIGRYAYTTYDEGGLLDANFTGSSSTTPSDQVSAKTSLAAADLRQLKDPSGVRLLSDASIDSLVARRATERFSERQMLIAFMQQTSPDSATRAGLQNALQFLGTSSRAIEQPSLAPPSSRPKVLAGYGNNGFGGDDSINPSFLNVRRAQSTTLLDGSISPVGDPVVSRRFPLNRLAWLTSDGPIADDAGQLRTEAAIQP